MESFSCKKSLFKRRDSYMSLLSLPHATSHLQNMPNPPGQDSHSERERDRLHRLLLQTPIEWSQTESLCCRHWSSRWSCSLWDTGRGGWRAAAAAKRNVTKVFQNRQFIVINIINNCTSSEHIAITPDMSSLSSSSSSSSLTRCHNHHRHHHQQHTTTSLSSTLYHIHHHHHHHYHISDHHHYHHWNHNQDHNLSTVHKKSLEKSYFLTSMSTQNSPVCPSNTGREQEDKCQRTKAASPLPHLSAPP